MSENSFVIEDGVLKKYTGDWKTAVIPEGLTETGGYAFEYCTELRLVKFPASLKTIESRASGSCVKLEAVNLPDGAESIGFLAFNCCPMLKRLNVPASVTRFGGGFYGCTGLEEVAVLGKSGVSRYTFQALVLEYRKRCLAPADLLAELEKGMAQIERRAKRAAKKAEKTPEQLAEELRSCKKRGGTICITSWKGECGKIHREDFGRDRFEGTPEDAAIPRMNGKTAVMALQYTFHVNRIGSINNGQRRRLAIPAGLKSNHGWYNVSGFPHLTVYAPAGSLTKNWAKENGLPFKALKDRKGD